MSRPPVVGAVSRQPSDSGPASGPRPGDRSTSTPPVRSRRRLLALVGSGGLLATAGCLSTLGSSGESNASAGLAPDRLAFPDGFDAEAASLAERYGDHGVWGLADGPGVDGPTYVGAYRDSLAVPSEEEGEGGDPWVTADLVAVVYRLDGSYRVWLWAGARARQPQSGLGRASVTRLSTGLTTREGWALDDYAPQGSFREGPVPVSLGERGPSGRTPLPGGGIAPGDGTRTGPAGHVGVAWQGIARGTRSVNAACALRPTDDDEGGDGPPLEVTATFGVAGGRGVL
jgi:hypothetical protein